MTEGSDAGAGSESTQRRAGSELGRTLSAAADAAGPGAAPGTTPLAAVAPQPSSSDGIRRAFVFGGGGVLGFAWMVGALTALQDDLDWDARSAQLAVGTSAGSVVAGLLGCGIPVDALRRHHQGVPAPGDPEIGYEYDSASGGALPPRPGLRPASPGLVLSALRGRGSRNPLVALSGLVPAGRGSLAPLHAMVSTIAERTGHGEVWPRRPAPWIVAVDYSTGRRTVFRDGHPTRSKLNPPARGRRRPGRRPSSGGGVPELPYGGRPAPQVALADAVVASCSIPGWYPPVRINGQVYIDGGAASNASVDLLRDERVDELIVLAPMASTRPDTPHTAVTRMERMVRRAVTRHILADIGVLEAAGTRVRLLTPGPDDLAEMGVNLMDPARRTAVLETAIRTTGQQLHDERERSVG